MRRRAPTTIAFAFVNRAGRQLNVHDVAVEVDHHAEAQHAQPLASVFGDGLADGVFHVVDGRFDCGLCEDVVLAHHVEHGADGHLAVVIHLLAHKAQHLAIDLGCVDIPTKVFVVDYIAGGIADIINLGGAPALVHH